MKPNKILFTVFFCCCHYFAQSQGEFITEINDTTGNFIKIGSAIAGITYIYANDGAYDESTGTFFFPSAAINHALYSVNTANGAIVNNPLIGDLHSFQFDKNAHILYGLEQDNPNNAKRFVSINPVTGITTQIGSSVPGGAAYDPRFSAFNSLNHVFIFYDPPNKLISIDASTGNVISSPNLLTGPGENIINFTYDDSTGVLYGLLQNASGHYYLASIDPSTGAIATIGPGTTFGLGLGASTIDEKHQKYIYFYSGGAFGGYAFTTIDIATGTMLHHGLIQAFTGQDNFFTPKYDNVHDKLYTIHWESSSLNTEIIDRTDKSKVYPNPACRSATIEFSNPEHKLCELAIYDQLGKTQLSRSGISGSSADVDVSNLAKGLYYYQVLNEVQILTGGKLVVE